MTTPEKIIKTQQQTGNTLVYQAGAAFLGDYWVRSWGAKWTEIAIRKNTALLSKDLLCFLNEVDDYVDLPGLDTGQRVERLKVGSNHLLEGTCTCDDACSPLYTKALMLHDTVLVDATTVRDSFQEIVEAATLQLVEPSVEVQRVSAERIGAVSMRLALNAGEKVMDNQAPIEIHSAAGKLGMFSYFLDLAYELDEDFGLGTQTYGTAQIYEGSTSSTTQQNLLHEANEYLSEGRSFLDAKQIRSYNALARLIHLKYKLEPLTPRHE